MEGLVNDVGGLVAPDLSTDAPDWCDNCQALRKENRRLQEEHGQNFAKLKQKIISTDLLIKKYKAKCDDYDLLYKKMEDVNKKSEKQMRQCSILETQLKAALLDVDPLRKSKAALEAETKEQAMKIQNLADKVVAFEGTQKQYEYMTKASTADVEKLEDEKKELAHKIKILESGKITKEAAKEYKVEISTLKKENASLMKNQQRLDKKLTAALSKIDTLTLALKDAKCSPIRRRRVPSGSVFSPMKSPLVRRSPKGRGVSPKPSPGNNNARRTRTLSGREINFIDKVADHPQTSDSDSESSDDKGSVSSLSWTFSPMVKCLSPLPPSPACFTQRVDSDAGSLSDIADELEQQLTEDLDTWDDVQDTQQNKLSPIRDFQDRAVDNEENDDDVNDTTLKNIEEQNCGEDLFDLSKYELDESENFMAEVPQENEISNLSDAQKISTEKDDDFVAEEHSRESLEETGSMNVNNITNDNDKSESMETKEIKPSSLALESECKTESDSQSGTIQTSEALHEVPLKKRVAHRQKNETTENNNGVVNEDGTMKKPANLPAQSSVGTTDDCSGKFAGLKEDQRKKTETGKEVDKVFADEYDKSKQLPRTDTSEFVPILHESTEVLSDFESDTEATSVQVVPDCKGDAASALSEEQEIKMEIEEQIEKVERQFTPSRGMLTRQRHFSDSSQSKHMKDHCEQNNTHKSPPSNVNKSPNSSQKKRKGGKGKPKYGKHNFINFQKSSSGTLADEIDTLATDVDYVCNDRSEIAARVTNEAIDQKRIGVTKEQLKKGKLRKYKDLDNITEDSNPEFSGQEFEMMPGNKQINLETRRHSKQDKLESENCVPDSKDTTPFQSCTEGSAKTVENNESGENCLRHRTRSQSNSIECETMQGIDNDKPEATDKNNKDDEDEIDVHKEVSEIVSKCAATDSASDAEKVQTSRQLSTGFVVNSPFCERSTEITSPGINLDKDKFEKKMAKLKGLNSSLCETVLENIQEEESEVDQHMVDSSNTDSAEVQNTTNSDEIIDQPGCSYNYNDEVEDVLSSSVSLSEEIERIMEKPGPSSSRVISCTPDLLDSEIAEFSQGDSRTASFDSDSVERRTPLSPLPISPFDFIIPISPLPPSPMREITRVSPLSPTHSEQDVEDIQDTEDVEDVELEHPPSTDQVDDVQMNVEEENVVSEITKQDLRKAILTKTKSELISVDDMKLCSIPAVLSPIRTPEHRKSCEKLKKSQLSAFKKVSKTNIQDGKKQTSSVSVKISFEKNVASSETKSGSTNTSQDSNKKQVPVQQKSGINKSVATFPQKSVIKDEKENAQKTDQSTKAHVATTKTDAHNSTTCSVTEKAVSKIKSKEVLTTTGEKSAVKTCTSENSAVKPSTSETPAVKTSTNEKPPTQSNLQLQNHSEQKSHLQNADKGENELGGADGLLEVPSGHDNLVTTKQKTRLAHRPNIKTLRPQKVQVIEAQALPVPTVGRKRKNLVAGDKDGQDKKQCKGATFQKHKKESSVSKEETKRMQGFLKSAETPEDFVTKSITATAEHPPGGSVASRILDCCLECLGRNRTDTTEVVYQICKSGDYRACQQRWPFLSDVEKQAVQLLNYLHTNEIQKLQYRTIMCRLWDSIVATGAGSVGIVGQMCYCRVFTALCSMEGDVEQARVLFCHMATWDHPNHSMFIVPMVSVWPEVLRAPTTAEFQPDGNGGMAPPRGLVTVLEEVVTRRLQANDLDLNKKIVFILQKLCGWRGECGDTEAILKALLTRLSETAAQEPVNNDLMYELRRSVHLLCVVGGWPWFKEFFIMRNGLQSAANKYKAKSIKDSVPAPYMGALLKIMGSVTTTLSTTLAVKEIEQFTRIWIFPIMAHAEADPVVSRACVEVLLELSPLLPSLVKGVNCRLPSQPMCVREEFKEKVDTLRRQYQAKMLL